MELHTTNDLDDIKLTNSNKETLKGAFWIETADGKIPYFLILKRIKNNEIDTEKYVFVDDRHNITWYWNIDIGGFYCEQDEGRCSTYKEFLTDIYDELDLVDLCMIPIEKSKQKDTNKYIATQQIIEELEEKYIELSTELDACQGATDNLDIEFAKLNIYKTLIQNLGGDIQSHLQELTNKYYEKRLAEQNKEQAEKETLDKVIELLPFPALELMSIDENIRNVIWKQTDKINDICNLLRKKFKENN